MYRGLGQLYAGHKNFRKFYDKYRPDLADFMEAAMAYSLVKSTMAFTFSCFASSNQIPQSTITDDVGKLFDVILYSLDAACI